MERFKKRLRLLIESCGGKLMYGNADSLTVQMQFGTASFEGTSYHDMICNVAVGDASRRIPLKKAFCFDVVNRIDCNHLCRSVLSYPKPPLLEFGEYMTEEDGANILSALQRDLLRDTRLERKKIGGNRILAEYYRGILILRDDLLSAGTNVFEFDATTPMLKRPT